MKTLKISDEIHQKLTQFLGELTAQTMKMQTYQDAIQALLNQSVILPPELIAQVENFIQENKHLGYTTKEEFIRDATRARLRQLAGEYETIEIPKEDYEELEKALKEMNAPYLNATDFIYEKIKEILERYEELKPTKRRR